MTLHRGRQLPLALLLLSSAVVACGGASPPKELVDARDAYARAQRGPAKDLNPAGLQEAEVALKRAERAYKDEDWTEARDLGYVAERKAELAEVQAATLDLERQQASMERLSEQQAAKEASQAKEELETTRGTLAEREAQLQLERQARAAAEDRALKALRELGAAANVRQTERGTVLTLPGTLIFASGQATLRPAATERLNQIGQVLSSPDQRDATIVIEGHTDSTGGDELNQELSTQRANAVRDYLASRGVPQERLTAEGKGEASPVADNSTPEGRAENRRVEIIISRGEQQGAMPGAQPEQPQPGAHPGAQPEQPMQHPGHEMEEPPPPR